MTPLPQLFNRFLRVPVQLWTPGVGSKASLKDVLIPTRPVQQHPLPGGPLR